MGVYKLHHRSRISNDKVRDTRCLEYRWQTLTSAQIVLSSKHDSIAADKTDWFAIASLPGVIALLNLSLPLFEEVT